MFINILNLLATNLAKLFKTFSIFYLLMLFNILVWLNPPASAMPKALRADKSEPITVTSSEAREN